MSVSETSKPSLRVEEHIIMTVDKFIFKVKKRYFYSQEGVWVKKENGFARVGVSDFVQKTIGDITWKKTTLSRPEN